MNTLKPTCAGPRLYRTLCSNPPTSRGVRSQGDPPGGPEKDGREGARQRDSGRRHFGLRGVPVTALAMKRWGSILMILPPPDDAVTGGGPRG